MANFGIFDVRKALSANISGKHAVAGAAAGTVGIGAVKYALNSIKVGGIPLASKIPAGLQRFTPLLTAVLAAVGGYALLKKASPKNANGFAIGALSSGVVLTVSDLLSKSFPAMADLTTYRLPGMGYLVGTNRRSMGMLIDTGKPRLNGLAESAMDDYVEYDFGG